MFELIVFGIVVAIALYVYKTRAANAAKQDANGATAIANVTPVPVAPTTPPPA